MAHEKQFTAKQVAVTVLEKVSEMLKKSSIDKPKEVRIDMGSDFNEVSALLKAEMPWKKPEQDADQHADGKAPKGEIHPKEKEQAPSDDVREQKDPQHNPKENAEGNNELAGTTPTQVGQDGKNIAGYDEMKGHLKLAKFIGRMEHKRTSKKALPNG